MLDRTVQNHLGRQLRAVYDRLAEPKRDERDRPAKPAEDAFKLPRAAGSAKP